MPSDSHQTKRSKMSYATEETNGSTSHIETCDLIDLMFTYQDLVWRGMAEIGIIYTEDQNVKNATVGGFGSSRGYGGSKSVYSFNLLDIERDYLSMDRRYTRLYVSPECAKVVVNWSREDLNIPLKTPITFNHPATDANPYNVFRPREKLIDFIHEERENNVQSFEKLHQVRRNLEQAKNLLEAVIRLSLLSLAQY
ncbi:cell division cycle and apoptosis regulator protein 1-like protein [Tanacetum coccineum]|uniref:Cell division cycle and apoptosis regulator protein 1-like protein n=1 Tax=Tanacetum coccineum TaxID=301880 RepID=A0ABQ4XEJ1_9ASTR